MEQIVQLVENPVYNLIKILNGQGLQILTIDGEYFTVTDFFPADRNTPYHKLKGKHITKIINDHLRVGFQGQQLISALQTIEGMLERNIQFSGDQSWRWMIN